jgi:hypothetical protein
MTDHAPMWARQFFAERLKMIEDAGRAMAEQERQKNESKA